MAEAAVGFLLGNLQRLLLHHTDLIGDAKNEVESLENELRFLRAFLKNFSKMQRKDEIRDLFLQIRDVAYKAEDIIDAFVSETKPKNYLSRGFQKPILRLSGIIEDVDSVSRKVKQMYSLFSASDLANPTVDEGLKQSKVPLVREDNLVGFEDDVALSYDRLPYHLKSCFLYFGMFPKDFEIPVWKLIRMWIAEGFVQVQKVGISPEEVAENYLEDLIEQNLVRVDKIKCDGKTKTCRIHDMLHDFCVKEAGNEIENFLQKMNKSRKGVFDPPISNVHKYRRLCIDHSNVMEFLSSKPYGPRVRSFVCFSEDETVSPLESISAIPTAFKLVRVLDVKPIRFTKFPSDMYRLVHLRYIIMFVNLQTLPTVFSKLWNLQTLVVDTTSRTLEIKANIWVMTQLRHLKTNASASLPKASRSGPGCQELQTLGTISPESCSKEVFVRSRNLKKLGIRGRLDWLLDGKVESFDSLRVLRYLEKLKLINDVFPDIASECPLHGLPQPYRFPPYLKSLTLSDTFLDWSHMYILGMLERLKVLKLKDNAFKGEMWEAADAGFRHLEVLHIGRTDLKIWVAKCQHFPRLRRLMLHNCEQLQQVPIELADIPSFRLLNLHHCKYAAPSAKMIQQAKQSNQTEETRNVTVFKLSVYPPYDE